MPSLKPSRLRGVACRVEVEEVRPKPSCDQRMATVPNPIRARLRIACTATWGSCAQAWMHRSPLLRPGSRLSAGKCGSSRSWAGRRSARPKRSFPSFSNRVGPKPNVRVRPEALSPRASPVSSGGASYGAATDSPTDLPAVIARAASVQLRSIATSCSRESVVTSNVAKCSRSCAGVVIPAWWAPWKSYLAWSTPWTPSVPSESFP